MRINDEVKLVNLEDISEIYSWETIGLIGRITSMGNFDDMVTVQWYNGRHCQYHSYNLELINKVKNNREYPIATFCKNINPKKG